MTGIIDQSAIGREWVHSHEEDAAYGGNVLVFRPTSYAFPPSRGRWRFQLNADNSMSQTTPGPTDRPHQQTDKWSLNSLGELVFGEVGPGKSSAVAKIVESSPQKLVITTPTPSR